MASGESLKQSDLGIRKWQNLFVEKASCLYQWCDSLEIPAENNYAEREICKVVIAHKLSYGSQSTAGAKTCEIWTSVLQSLHKRVPHPHSSPDILAPLQLRFLL